MAAAAARGALKGLGSAKEKVLDMVKESGGVLEASSKAIDQFNTWFGGVDDVKDKTRWLQVTLVNMSTEHTLSMEDSWFDSGRFWSQPFQSIPPGTSLTFFVCNVDGGFMTGVSGGIGLQARTPDNIVFGDDDGNSWWICTFANPFSGSEKCLTRWKRHGIKPLWNEMDTTHTVRDSRCGCYMEADKKMVFMYKDPDSPW